MTGKVYLVGAGPGDAELLTMKAARLLRSADVVLHDALVGPEVLAMIHSRAIIVDVGKRANRKHFPQAEIGAAMVRYASSGKTVVRLKGGDPLLFARAGEEIEALRRAGIEFEIVPGVTAALGAAAAGQFPLTDRNSSSSVLLVSGHSCIGNAPVNWVAAVKTGATIVVYMPGDASALAASLLAAGIRPATPCALVSHASLPQQRVERYTVASLPEETPPAPNLLIIGEVVDTAQLGLVPHGLSSWNQLSSWI